MGNLPVEALECFVIAERIIEGPYLPPVVGRKETERMEWMILKKKLAGFSNLVHLTVEGYVQHPEADSPIDDGIVETACHWTFELWHLVFHFHGDLFWSLLGF